MTQTILNLSNHYSISDLALATTISLFFPIEAIDRQNPNKVQFLFKRNRNLTKLIKNYWQGKLRIEPQNYFNQLKAIKSRIYSETEERLNLEVELLKSKKQARERKEIIDYIAKQAEEKRR